MADGFLCNSCLDKLAIHLSSVPDVMVELEVTFSRQDAIGVELHRGGDNGLPYAVQAAAMIAELTLTVGYWARVTADGRGVSYWDIPNTLDEVAAWLGVRLDWLRLLEAAGEAFSQVDSVMARCWRICDRPLHRTRFYVGPCPEIGEDNRYCMGAVWAFVPLRVGVDPAVMRCLSPECARHSSPWTTDMWLKGGERILRRKAQLQSRYAMSGQ